MSGIKPGQYFRIEKYSHHFVLKDISPSGSRIIDSFARRFVQFGLVKVGRVFKQAPVKVFASKIVCKNEVRFHTGQWDAFNTHLLDNGVTDVVYTVEEFGFVEPYPLGAVINDKRTPFDYQIPIIEYLKSSAPSEIKLVEIQPGAGKTFISGCAMSDVGHRIVSFLKPKYLEKWVNDLEDLMNIHEDDISVIQGASSLMEVIRLAKADELTSKVILVSNRTFQSYISLYEKHGDKILEMGYDCLPGEFTQVLRAGVKLVDEVHEDFHLNFKIDLFCHVPKSISLSATLVSDDRFISQMHEVAYPKAERYYGLPYNKYVTSYALRYRIKDGEFLQSTERGSNMYSHMAFEKNFFKNSKLMKAYLELIASRFEEHYLTRAEGDQRCLIYAASILMCTAIVEYFKKRYPDLDVRRYVEDDPYDNLMRSKVCVSTIGSAGTGHDIPNLITVLLTVAISSKASNIQGFGRLRDLKTVKGIFEYFTCMDVPKHVEYHDRKEILLATMAKEVHLVNLPYTVGES